MNARHAVTAAEPLSAERKIMTKDLWPHVTGAAGATIFVAAKVAPILNAADRLCTVLCRSSCRWRESASS